MKTNEYHIEIVIHDDLASMLAPMFLPPVGTMVSADVIRDACARLAQAVREYKQMEREGRRPS